MWFEDIYVFRIAWMYVKIYDVLYIYLQMQGVHRTHTHTHISCLDVEGSVLFSFAILSYSIPIRPIPIASSLGLYDTSRVPAYT